MTVRVIIILDVVISIRQVGVYTPSYFTSCFSIGIFMYMSSRLISLIPIRFRPFESKRIDISATARLSLFVIFRVTWWKLLNLGKSWPSRLDCQP